MLLVVAARNNACRRIEATEGAGKCKAVFGTGGAGADAGAGAGMFPCARRPRVSSTKGLTGHPLSLSGAMEAAFCVVAMNEGFIPGNPHLVNPDPACEGLDLPRASVAERPRVVLNNSSGFGGSNVCHVLRAVDFSEFFQKQKMI